MELKINERFKKFIPPLSDSEVQLLKEDILANGCRDPLVVWNGIIVDGHHRYAICKEYGIPFEVVEKSFSDESEALIWIAKNQLGRRNLNAFQRCELVLPLEPGLAAETEKRRKAGISLCLQTGEKSSGGKKTRDILSEMAGVSHTLLCQVKAILEAADEETMDKLRRGEIRVNAAYKRTVQEQKDAVAPPKGIVVVNHRSADDTAVILIRELLRKVTYGEADPEMVIMELTRILEMMEARDGKETV